MSLCHSKNFLIPIQLVKNKNFSVNQILNLLHFRENGYAPNPPSTALLPMLGSTTSKFSFRYL